MRRRQRCTKVSPGDLVAEKYRVERVLGEGGMGYVVAAWHLELRHRVALKFMREEIVTEESTRRFFQEARSVASLQSRHFARVLDVGMHDGDVPYIVMEHLDGCDLSELLEQRGLLAASEACEYVTQACEALAEAHGHGIVHRDLKPGNLFLARSFIGEHVIKVLDFGVSKAGASAASEWRQHARDGASPAREGEEPLTTAGEMLGSPNFMAPEQLMSARDVDARSDVWSLGVILYCLLAGRSPFDAEGMGQIVQNVVRGAVPDLRALRPDLPAGLEHVIGACLERDRERRVPDCFALVLLLAPYLSPSGPRSAERIAVRDHAMARAAQQLGPRVVSVTSATAPTMTAARPTPAPAPRPGFVHAPSPAAGGVHPERAWLTVGLSMAATLVVAVLTMLAFR